MNSSDAGKTPEPLDVESLLATVSLRETSESSELEALLPRLEFASALLASTPGLIVVPSLVFRGRDGRVQIRPIAGGICVGRADECEICFPRLREVSRLHFRIAADDSEYVLTDSGSSNGTFVWGLKERITKHILRDGDIIEAAGFEFLFVKG